jgi:hypothetical protein
MAKKTENVELAEIKLSTIEMVLIGDSPLVMHKFSHKAQAEMLAKQVKVTKSKEAKDPAAQYDEATYFITENGTEVSADVDIGLIVTGKVNEFNAQVAKHIEKLRKIKNPLFGMPAVAFKACAIRGSKALGMVMADMRGAFHIPVEFVQIHGARNMRCDMVRISMTSDVRFRPEFKEWWARFFVTYNSGVITPHQLLNMFNSGGFSCGIGEWRPEKGGTFGMFHVATEAEKKSLK